MNDIHVLRQTQIAAELCRSKGLLADEDESVGEVNALQSRLAESEVVDGDNFLRQGHVLHLATPESTTVDANASAHGFYCCLALHGHEIKEPVVVRIELVASKTEVAVVFIERDGLQRGLGEGAAAELL